MAFGSSAKYCCNLYSSVLLSTHSSKLRVKTSSSLCKSVSIFIVLKALSLVVTHSSVSANKRRKEEVTNVPLFMFTSLILTHSTSYVPRNEMH